MAGGCNEKKEDEDEDDVEIRDDPCSTLALFRLG